MWGFPQPDYGGGKLLVRDPTAEERRAERKHRRLSLPGLALMGAGFAAQFVAIVA